MKYIGDGPELTDSELELLSKLKNVGSEPDFSKDELKVLNKW